MNSITCARRTFSRITQDFRETQDAIPIVVLTSCTMMVPWMLFVGNTVFSDSCIAISPGVFVGVYFLSAAIAHILSMHKPLLEKFSYPWLAHIGTGLFFLGMISIYLGGAIFMSFSVQTFGVVLCAAGNSFVLSQWYIHYSRLSIGTAFLLASMSALLCIALIIALSLMIDFLRIPIIAFIYVIAAEACLKAIPKYCSIPPRTASSILDTESFLQQNKYVIYVLMIAASFAFGYSVVDGVYNGILEISVISLDFCTWILLAAILNATVVILSYTRGFSCIGLTCSLSVGCLIIGLILATSGIFSPISRLLIFEGFFLLNVFYLSFYSGLCSLRAYNTVSFPRILFRTRFTIPSSFLAAYILYRAELLFSVSIGYSVMVFMGVFLLIVYMVMSSNEISVTRNELSIRGVTSISLEDVKRFAAENENNYRLTKRECEIIQLVMSGHSVDYIAEELVVSKSTVKTHISSVYKKMGIHKRREMIEILSKSIKR